MNRMSGIMACIFLGVITVAATTWGEKAVTVTSEEAKVTAYGRTIATVKKGEHFAVVEEGQQSVKIGVMVGDKKKLGWLKKSDCAFDIADGKGETAPKKQLEKSLTDQFFAAIESGDATKAKAMLKRDPNLMKATPRQSTRGPLHEAALRAQKEVVLVLIEAGADVNARSGGDNATPLGCAFGGASVYGGMVMTHANTKESVPKLQKMLEAYEGTIEALVTNHAEVNDLPPTGVTLLDTVEGWKGVIPEESEKPRPREGPVDKVMRDFADRMAVFLRAHGARRGEELLKGTKGGARASSPEDDRMATKAAVLIRQSASYAKTAEGQKVLEEAVKQGYTATVRLLLENGADANGKTQGVRGLQGQALLQVAIENGRNEIAKLLIANHADVNVRADQTGGKTPLLLAVEKGDVGLAGLLLAKGADVNAQDPLDHIPLSEPNTAEMFELLQAHKAVGMQGRTPLHVAADYGLKEAVERLLSGQADVKATDKNGDTPLHLAVAGLVKSSGWLPGQGMVPPVGPQGGSGVPPGGWRPPFPGVPGSVGPTGSGQRPSTPGSAHTQPRGPTVSQPPGSAPQFPCDATKKAAYWSIVTLLLEHKADPNEKNLRGQAPWNVAVVGMIGGRSGEVSDLLRLLERHGADLPAVWRSGAKEK